MKARLKTPDLNWTGRGNKKKSERGKKMSLVSISGVKRTKNMIVAVAVKWVFAVAVKNSDDGFTLNPLRLWFWMQRTVREDGRGYRLYSRQDGEGRR